ncbi:MAG: hypothetical protein JW874_10820 [Spirochaetales bacterium]|nr:hypothetical protein [Spirochaetales bacterium]
MGIRIKIPLLLLFLAVLTFQLGAANLFIPELELITRGYVEDGRFKLATRGDIDFLIEGGYKFGGEIKLHIYTPNIIEGLALQDETIEDEADALAYLNNTGFLVFEGANIQIREIFNINLNFSFFLGEFTSFCSGDLFSKQFGTAEIGTRFRGYLYFPEALDYNGVHTVNGTGISIMTDLKADSLQLSLYLYQDAYMEPGIYSSDFDLAINLERFKLEFFAGATFPDTDWGSYRAGLLLYYKAGEIGEFLTEIGIPKFSSEVNDFNIQLFYFLFEPRINLGFMSIIPTFFWHPQYYLQEETGQEGAMDFNLNLRFGNPVKFPLTGGIESTFSYGSTSSSSFETLVSPYISFISSGVQWDIKAIFQVFPWEPEQLIEAFIGITAEL